MLKKLTTLHTALFAALCFCNLHAMAPAVPGAAASGSASAAPNDADAQMTGELLQIFTSDAVQNYGLAGRPTSFTEAYQLASDPATIVFLETTQQ